MALLRFGNDSNVTFGGYLRATVDTALAFPNGAHELGYFVLGNDCGRDTKCIDVYCGVSPNGDRRQIDTNEATPMGWSLGASPLSGFIVTFAGQAMTFVGEQANGAHWDGEWYVRIGNMLNVRVWVAWYPDDTQYAYVEIAIYCSNPSVTDVVQSIPANFKLVFDTATVMMCGLADNAVIMAEGDYIGDGQTRVVTGVLCYPGQGSGGDPAMCRALADQKIQLLGISKAFWCGNPNLPPGPFPPPGWNTATLLADATSVLNSWSAGILDPAYSFHTPGAQGSQGFEQGPAMADVCAFGPFYLAALAHRMPNVHAESDGRLLDPPPAHPYLRLFEGRVNRAFNSYWQPPGYPPNSMDVLGKTAGDPSSAQCHGASGPSDQHNFDWNRWFAKRAKGTRALEWLCSAWARITLFQSPIAFPPGNWLTDSPRGQGWLLFMCVEGYVELTDRTLADQLKQNAIDLVDILMLPRFLGQSPPGEAWWQFHYDFGLPPGHGQCQGWQACIQALALRWCGEVFGHAGSNTLSLEMATAIIPRLFVQFGGRWTSKDVISEDGLPISGPEGSEEIGGVLTGYNLGAYDFFFVSHALAAMLMANPSHAQARVIWTQLLGEAGTWNAAASLAPGVNLSAPSGIIGVGAGTTSTSIAATGSLLIRGQFAANITTTISATGSLPISGRMVVLGDNGFNISTSLISVQTNSGQLAATITTSMAASGVIPGSGSLNATISTTMVATGSLPIAGSTLDSGIVITTTLVAAGTLPISGRTAPGLGITTTLNSHQTVGGKFAGSITTFIKATGVRPPAPPPPPEPPKPPKPGHGPRPRPRPNWWDTEPIMDFLKWLSRRR